MAVGQSKTHRQCIKLRQRPQAYAIAPSNAPAPSAKTVDTNHASLGIHDSIRHGGPRSLHAESMPSHPLKRRLEEWDGTQDQLKFQLQRNLYGMHMPIRQMMERDIVSATPAFGIGLNSVSQLHMDVLTGKDESVDLPDVLTSAKEEAFAKQAMQGDMHAAAERRLRL